MEEWERKKRDRDLPISLAPQKFNSQDFLNKKEGKGVPYFMRVNFGAIFFCRRFFLIVGESPSCLIWQCQRDLRGREERGEKEEGETMAEAKEAKKGGREKGGSKRIEADAFVLSFV